jgi:hypothetical protein
MRWTVISGALLLTALPVSAAPNPAGQPATTPTKGQTSSTSNKPDFDLSQLTAVFDRLFPAQPDPPPQRLNLSRTAVKGLFPDGTYARMMTTMMHTMVERFMSLSEADLAMGGKKGTPPDTTTMRQEMAKDDPHFEERMQIIQRVLTDEFTKFAALIEPRIREGLARSMARRFDEKQLADINAFLATDSGRAFGSQSMAMWLDTDVMRAVMQSMPDMMTAMPQVMKRIETETAHLPKPKPKPKPATNRRPRRAK